MICSSRSHEKFMKQGLSWSCAKYKATYAYVYLADKIRDTRSKIHRNPNEIDQWILNVLLTNKEFLLNAKTDNMVDYICHHLCGDLLHEFEINYPK